MDRPNVIAIYSQSLSGQLALSSGETNAERKCLGLTNEEDSAHFKARIDGLDAVLCTRSTMIHERGAVRNRQRSQCPWFVAASEAHLSRMDDLALWKQAGVPVMGVSFQGELSTQMAESQPEIEGERELRAFLLAVERGESHARAKAQLRWPRFLSELGAAGIGSLGVLGGPGLLSWLLEEGQLDRLEISLMPSFAPGDPALRVLGSLGASLNYSLHLIESKGNVVFLTYLKA